MRVLGILTAWGVLAVLATLCFAVGGSIGYRRGVQDAVRQLRERRAGKTGCRPLPLPHQHRRPATRIVSNPVRRAASPARAAHARASAPPAIHRLRAYLAPPYLSPALAGALAAIALLAVPGVALGATGAQPGETLWPVKLEMDRARVAVATGADSKMRVHVAIASRRLGELNTLLNDDSADQDLVGAVIADLRDHTQAASVQLDEIDVVERKDVVGAVDEVVQRQVKVIDTLIDIDCVEPAGDATCEQLDDTRIASVNLRDETTAVAAAGPTGVGEPAASASVAPGPSPAAALASATPGAPAGASAAPTTGTTAAASSGAAGSTSSSTGAAAGATSGADPSAKPSASPSAPPSAAPPTPAAATPGGGGDDADEATAGGGGAAAPKTAKTAETDKTAKSSDAGTGATAASGSTAATPAP